MTDYNSSPAGVADGPRRAKVRQRSRLARDAQRGRPTIIPPDRLVQFKWPDRLYSGRIGRPLCLSPSGVHRAALLDYTVAIGVLLVASPPCNCRSVSLAFRLVLNMLATCFAENVEDCARFPSGDLTSVLGATSRWCKLDGGTGTPKARPGHHRKKAPRER